MTFSTLTFIFLFMPVLLLAYFVLPKKWMPARNGVLLAASVLFYAWGEPANVFLILLCVGCTYLACFGVAKRSKLALFFGIIVNLLPLLVYKYADFILININTAFGVSVPMTGLLLPAGISFYTFQVLTYVIDLYRGRVSLQKNPAYLTLYVFFFPQLIAGPIVRYADIEHQLRHRQSTLQSVSSGARRFIFGLAKKMLANQAGFIVTTIAAQPQTVIGADLRWISVIAYGVQIYYDFSGYSDMAIGLGRIFGFSFMENFNKPYIARSITDFWRRWHISLSTFFRDYIYIPLGGDGRTTLPDGRTKTNAAKHIRNLFIVWLLTGLWHGASWNFALWGLYFFVLLLLEKYLYGKWLASIPVALSRLFTYLLYTFGWAIFMFETNSIAALGQHLSLLFTGGASAVGPRALGIQGNIIIMAVALVLSMVGIGTATLDDNTKSQSLASRIIKNTIILALFVVSVFLIVGESFNPFIYFRF